MSGACGSCPENTNTTIYRCLRCPNPAWQPSGESRGKLVRLDANGDPVEPLDAARMARYVYGDDGDYWPDAQVVTFSDDA